MQAEPRDEPLARGEQQVRAGLAVLVELAVRAFPAHAGAVQQVPGAPPVVELVVALGRLVALAERAGPAAEFPGALPAETA